MFLPLYHMQHISFSFYNFYFYYFSYFGSYFIWVDVSPLGQLGFSFPEYKYYCKTFFFKNLECIIVVYCVCIVKEFSYFGYSLNYFDLSNNQPNFVASSILPVHVS
jgi:hypothetical protein